MSRSSEKLYDSGGRCEFPSLKPKTKPRLKLKSLKSVEYQQKKQLPSVDLASSQTRLRSPTRNTVGYNEQARGVITPSKSSPELDTNAQWNGNNYEEVNYFTRNLILSDYWFNQKGSVIYENLCEGCGYGVFEADGKLCDFCRYAVNGQFKESANIYENVCENCREIYSGSKCDVCAAVKAAAVVTAPPRKPKKSESFKTNRIFSGFFDTLRKVRSRSSSSSGSQQQSQQLQKQQYIQHSQQQKHRKLEIVHNVDSVFRTNETFDLTRICELKRLQSTSDNHIYGKLRKSDDQLACSFDIRKRDCYVSNSKSDPSLHKVSSWSKIAIRPSFQNSGVDKRKQTDKILVAPKIILHDHVIEWMTSLRRQIDDYSLLPDDSICNTKSIPSRNFSCCGHNVQYTSVLPYRSGTDTLDSALANDADCQRLVSDFKRTLMEKQRSKRKGIYVKNDDLDAVVPRSVSVDSDRNALLIKGNRYGCCETDSDFVSDVLSVFEAFMSGGGETQQQCNSRSPAATSGSALTDRKVNPTSSVGQETESPLVESVSEDLKSRSDRARALIKRKVEHKEKRIACLDVVPVAPGKTLSYGNGCVGLHGEQVFRRLLCKPKVKRAHLRNLAAKYVLAHALNCIVFIPDKKLSAFLRAIDCSRYRGHPIEKLYRLFLIMNNTNSLEEGASSSVLVSCNRRYQRVGRRKRLERRAIHVADGEDPEMLKGIKDSAIKKLSDINGSENISEVSGTVTTNSIAVTSVPDTKTSQADNENIYQPIWKFKTVGTANDSYSTGDEPHNESIPQRADDYSEWETDDEFMFSSKMTLARVSETPEIPDETHSDTISIQSDTKILNTSNKELKTTNTVKTHSSNPNVSVLSANSTQCRGSFSVNTSISGSVNVAGNNIGSGLYQSVCVFFSVIDPRLRGVIYDYDHNKTYFKKKAEPSTLLSQPKQEEVQVQRVLNNGVKTESRPSTWIPDCVHAWKFMLLDVNYIEDEEDMYISEDELLRLKEIDTGTTLQRNKSVSVDNLLEIEPGQKKSLSERVRNTFNKGVLKISGKNSREKKDKEYYKSRAEVTSYIYVDEVKPLFGAELVQVEKSLLDNNVPKLVTECIDIIEKKANIECEGIYRQSGNKISIDELKKKLSETSAYYSLLHGEDIHTLTGILKLFFRELQEPLIPYPSYQQFPESLVNVDLQSIKQILHNISQPSQGTLKYLLRHLTTVAKYSAVNRMPSSNLAIIWGPCIFQSMIKDAASIGRTNTITRIIIEHYDILFGDDERLIN